MSSVCNTLPSEGMALWSQSLCCALNMTVTKDTENSCMHPSSSFIWAYHAWNRVPFTQWCTWLLKLTSVCLCFSRWPVVIKCPHGLRSALLLPSQYEHGAEHSGELTRNISQLRPPPSQCALSQSVRILAQGNVQERLWPWSLGCPL